MEQREREREKSPRQIITACCREFGDVHVDKTGLSRSQDEKCLGLPDHKGLTG